MCHCARAAVITLPACKPLGCVLQGPHSQRASDLATIPRAHEKIIWPSSQANHHPHLRRIQILPTPSPFPFTQGYLPKGQPPRKAAYWTKQEEPWARWGRRPGTPQAYVGEGAQAPSGDCTRGRPLRGSPPALRSLALRPQLDLAGASRLKHILPTGFRLFADPLSLPYLTGSKGSVFPYWGLGVNRGVVSELKYWSSTLSKQAINWHITSNSRGQLIIPENKMPREGFSCLVH